MYTVLDENSGLKIVRLYPEDQYKMLIKILLVADKHLSVLRQKLKIH